MRFTTLATIATIYMLKPAAASWSLRFYETGCPTEGDIGDSVALTAGEPDDELWCIPANAAHNVVATNIAADNMKVTLFTDTNCMHVITDFETDGCKVIPKDVSFSFLAAD
ncbi:hypothetical protein F5B22DRAFT_366688 [Xylaria bambusicola]|uniref:uncharacterized protein n=1 Tax=Xylaria bambusicola TaxID=326684 RepID=UPI002008A845|nr:uncharacterized protein F5B22DRAFT_366688 [Xylaria bambusicola]KAI0509216.1 hypothetical protein F5B22DRAFT_366688 [Xylaria bambusicola]